MWGWRETCGVRHLKPLSQMDEWKATVRLFPPFLVMMYKNLPDCLHFQSKIKLISLLKNCFRWCWKVPEMWRHRAERESKHDRLLNGKLLSERNTPLLELITGANQLRRNFKISVIWLVMQYFKESKKQRSICLRGFSSAYQTKYLKWLSKLDLRHWIFIYCKRKVNPFQF